MGYRSFCPVIVRQRQRNAMVAARVAVKGEVEVGGEGGCVGRGAHLWSEDSQLGPLGNEKMKLPLAP